MRKNYCEWLYIKQALNEAFEEFDFSKLRTYLWKDEIDDVFLLTRYMEIYLYDKNTLRCYCFSPQKRSQAHKMGVNFNDHSTDDSLYVFDSDIKNLPILIALGKPFKRKPYINGNWIKSMEKKLGHKIKPFRPTFQDNKLHDIIHNEIDMQKYDENHDILCVELAETT